MVVLNLIGTIHESLMLTLLRFQFVQLLLVKFPEIVLA